MLARQIPALCPDCVLSAFEWCHRHLVLNETKYKVQNNNRKEKKSIRRVYINSAWHKNGTFPRLLYPCFLLWLIPSFPGHWALGGRSPLSRAASWLCRFLSRLYGKSGISFITKVPDRWLFPERIVLSAPWSNGASFRTRLGGGARTHWFAFALKNPFRTLDRLRKKKEEKKKEKWMQGMSSFRNSNKQGAARVISWFGWRKSVIGCLDHSQAQKQRLFSPIVRSSPIVRNSGQKNGTQNNLWVLSDTEAFTLRSHKIAPDGNYTGFYTGSLTPIFIRANLCTYNHNKVHFSSQHYKTLEKYKGGEYFCKAPYIFIHL